MANTIYEGPNWVQVNMDGSGDYTTAEAKHWNKVYLGSKDAADLLADYQSIVVAELDPLASNTDLCPRKRLTFFGAEREMRLDMKVPSKLLIDISQSTMTDWTKALIILEHK
jgi:hypothetical protein